MSKKTYIVGVSGTLVALVFVLTNALLAPSPGVTKANCARIQPGMTLEEVERIFGGSPAERIDHWLNGPPQSCAWYGGSGDAIVDFRKDGRVRRADWSSHKAEEPGLHERLRGWLGW
jgi:hypothetical protein